MEGSLTGSSLTIYFHHNSAKPRQAKFVSSACHGVGSFTAAFSVGAPQNGMQETRAVTVYREGDPWEQHLRILLLIEKHNDFESPWLAVYLRPATVKWQPPSCSLLHFVSIL